jgi:peptide/nickel transport system permease protein
LKNAIQFDLGTMPQGEPIAAALARTCVVSIGLLSLALITSILVGLPLGLNAVRGAPPKVSAWLTALVTVGLASPSYYIGVLLIAGSVAYLIWGPGSAPLLPFQGYGWDMHLVLPTLALAFLPTVKIAQITSGMLVDEMGKQYVVAARSFGHTQRSIRNRIAFRNILAAVVITIAASLRLMVAELIIIERLFGWPGFGRLIASSVILKPSGENLLLPPLLAAILTALAAFFLLTDLVAGVLVRIFDPRQVEA